MIIILICTVFGLFGGWLGGYNGLSDAIIGALTGATVGFLVAMIVGAFAYTGTEFHPVHRTPLVSMADGAGVEGHFFLGSGSLDSESVFTWYQTNGDNSYVRKSADAENSTIHYLKDGEKPYYVFSKERGTPGGFFQPWGLNTTSGWGAHYDFYVPRGSIIQSYTLDNR